MGMTTDITSLDERARLDFVLTLRRRWADQLYPAFREEYAQATAAPDVEPPRDGHEAEAVVADLPLAAWFSWMERAQQKMMWRVVQDAVVARWDHLAPLLTVLPADPAGTLELDPLLELPRYYTAFDIHLQPGGVWTDDVSAFVYEEGAQIVMLRDNDEYRFHTLMVQTAMPQVDELSVSRIVDMGCGFGKSTRPFADAYPGAEVIGVDLSAPVLRLAHATAERMGKSIRFVQADIADTGLEATSTDIVTGTMVLHEMPMAHVQRVLHEAARLLKPGGAIRFLEFAQTGDPFRDASVYGHGERNNEPWIPALMDADVIGMCEAAGLEAASWTPFDERTHGLSPDGWGERDEWHFPWAVLSAHKSARNRVAVQA